jgi:hypothetical protein
MGVHHQIEIVLGDLHKRFGKAHSGIVDEKVEVLDRKSTHMIRNHEAQSAKHFLFDNIRSWIEYCP